MDPRPFRNPAGARWLFGVAIALFALYVVNIALGMLAVKGGVSTWRLGDVGEFVLVLSCMGFFVAGLVTDERPAPQKAEEAVDSNPIR
ncbi:MAG: hypothetical protein ABIR52_03415 [Casimicrobiaceae bacterium]